MNWTIYPVGDGDPIFSFVPMSAPDDDTVLVSADVAGLDVGTYEAKYLIVPEFSLNEPETVTVVLNLTEQTADPIPAVTQDHYEFLFKAGQVSTGEQPLEVLNLAGGCMEWYVLENTVWLDVEPDTGQVPGEAWVGVNGFGLPFGKTSTTFDLYAVEAPGSPVEVTVDLYVWTFGDADCSGQVDIDDVVYLIMYIFSGGPEPCPRRWVGDVNCTHGDVDIDDVVYLINWIFLEGPDPCDWGGRLDTGQLPATHTFIEGDPK
jgi:hypothetical protein